MEENCQFVKDCIALKVGEQLTRERLTFDELFNLKYPANSYTDSQLLFLFHKFRIIATTTEDHEMDVWNGTHPVEENSAKHICKASSTVLVWMVSRFGDVGITDNLVNARGYDLRIDPDKLINWRITRQTE
jgi:hypothetical protein